jgi:hypothetical protein
MRWAKVKRKKFGDVPAMHFWTISISSLQTKEIWRQKKNELQLGSDYITAKNESTLIK